MNALRFIERVARQNGNFDVADMARQQADAYELSPAPKIYEWCDRGNPVVKP